MQGKLPNLQVKPVHAERTDIVVHGGRSADKFQEQFRGDIVAFDYRKPRELLKRNIDLSLRVLVLQGTDGPHLETVCSREAHKLIEREFPLFRKCSTVRARGSLNTDCIGGRAMPVEIAVE